MEKKFLPENKADISLEFLPPRLVEAVQGWYIVFYQTNPATGELERERKSYKLGRVGERERKKRGNELCAVIKKLLPLGYPWVAQGKVYELKKGEDPGAATGADGIGGVVGSNQDEMQRRHARNSKDVQKSQPHNRQLAFIGQTFRFTAIQIHPPTRSSLPR